MSSTGHICDHEIDYCVVDGCDNGAACTKHIGGRTCNCSGSEYATMTSDGFVSVIENYDNFNSMISLRIYSWLQGRTL